MRTVRWANRRTVTAAAILVTVAADVATTLWFRSKGIPESNPLVAGWVDNTTVFITVKMGWAIAAAVAVWHTNRFRWAVWATIGLMTAAATVNTWTAIRWPG